MDLSSRRRETRQFDPNSVGRRKDFYMELLRIWEGVLDRFHADRNPSPEAKRAAWQFENAIACLKRTYRVDELEDLEEIYEGVDLRGATTKENY